MAMHELLETCSQAMAALSPVVCEMAHSRYWQIVGYDFKRAEFRVRCLRCVRDV